MSELRMDKEDEQLHARAVSVECKSCEHYVPTKCRSCKYYVPACCRYCEYRTPTYSKWDGKEQSCTGWSMMKYGECPLWRSNELWWERLANPYKERKGVHSKGTLGICRLWHLMKRREFKRIPKELRMW